MDKHRRRQPQVLEPLKQVDYIKHPEVICGAADVTRPRDIYTFLSLGYITAQPTGPTRKPKKQSDLEHLRIASGKLPSSFYSDINQNNPASYVFFNTLNTRAKLPDINKDDNHEDNNDNGENEITEIEPGESNLQPRQSIINEDDYGINITQTFIFAPPERFQETVKYNKNVILPKIKPKRKVSGEKSKEEHNNLITSKPKQVHFNPDTTDTSPRSNDMNSSHNYLFGTRPECLFLNNRLGDKNPLLRSNKESPSLTVPKASPGLQDLKDYDEYPDVYWQLRDGTITQPEDLEADMIDRDLYRLRQISALKLNTVEKTFQVHQDPFRKWRWKAGEPIFSPKQQQRPLNCRSMRDKKIKDIPIYPQALSKPQLKITVSPMKPPNHSHQNMLLSNQDPLSSSRTDNTAMNHNSLPYKSDMEFDNAPGLPNFDTPRDSSLGGNTPGDLGASLESYRRMGEELAEDEKLGKIPIHKLHELRGKKHKQPIKTSLVHVDLEPLDSYRREHKNTVTKSVSKNFSKGVGYSHRLELYRDCNFTKEAESNKMETHRSFNNNNNNNNEHFNGGVITTDITTDDSAKEDENNAGDAASPRKRVPAPVSTLVLQPELSRLSLCPPGELINSWDVDAGTLSSATALANRPGITSPMVSDSSGNMVTKERRRANNITPVRPVHLEVFSERVDGNGVIKIPTGRISYQRSMPTYKLDLVNYPPSNARQSCYASNSAGVSDGRSMTHMTNTNTLSTAAGSRKQTRVRSSGATAGEEERNATLKSNGADTGVSITFGHHGHVIVSTSREGRQSR